MKPVESTEKNSRRTLNKEIAFATTVNQVLWEGRRRRRLQDTRYWSSTTVNAVVHRERPAGLSRRAWRDSFSRRRSRPPPGRYHAAPRWNGIGWETYRTESRLKAAGRVHTEHAECSRVKTNSGAGHRCPPGTRHRVRGRRRRENLARTGCVGPRRDRVVRCVVLRDTTHQSCRERAVSTRVGSNRDTSGNCGDTGGGVDSVRKRMRALTNESVVWRRFVG